MEYTVDFHRTDGTSESRKYSLINITTNRARAIAKRFIRLNQDGSAPDIDYISGLMSDESMMNNLMSSMLSGNHDGVSWFDADMDICDKIINDFFSSFIEKMNT